MVRTAAVVLSFCLLPPVSLLLSPVSLFLSPLSFAQTRPLPDPDTFYEATQRNLVRSQRAAHLYTYKERRTDLHTNPFGKIGTGGTRLFEVYPSPNRELAYWRLIERNRVPIPEKELEEQDRGYRDKVAEVQQRLAHQTADDRRRIEALAADARRKGQAMVEDAIGALRFAVERRERYQGVDAIVITFTPKPDAKPSTREGRIAQKFAGTAWVHEAEAEVMRIEAKAIEHLSFGFGIVARLGQGTTATMTRRPVEGGLWMPTELTLTGHGRAALFRRLVINHVVQWFEYERLSGDSLTPFLDRED